MFNVIATIMSSMLKQLHGLSQQKINGASIKPRLLFPKDVQAKERSQAIDRALKEDAKTRKRQCNVLPLGTHSGPVREVVKHIKKNGGIGLTKGELIDYRYNVHQCVITCIKALVEFMKMSEIRLESDINDHYDYLCGYIAYLDPDAPLNSKVGKAINVIWKDSSIAETFQPSAEPCLIKPARYFFGEISRITTPDYIPTEADVLQSHKGIQGVSKHRFVTDELSINLIEAGGYGFVQRKCMHQFEDITAILYVIDLPCYDEDLSSDNVMAEQMEIFDIIVNSKSFTNAIFILFLSEVSVFRQRLTHTPLKNYFPDYSGGTDVEKAGEYLLQRFRQVNRGQRSLCSYVVDPCDTSNMQLVSAAIMDSIRSTSKAHG